MLTSKNIRSKIHIIAMLTTMLKNPKVIILKGRVMAFNTGFTKKLRSPSIMPKIKKNCHLAVKGKPKKLDSEFISIIAPRTNDDAVHSPATAAII